MKKLSTFGTITNGKLHISKRAQFNKAISMMPDCRIELVLRKLYNQRSDHQNRYYWGVIVNIWQDLLLEAYGEFYSIQDTHDFLKTNFNFEEKVFTESGLVLRTTKSTTKNTTVDQEEYHERCRRAAFDNFGVEIPLPNEQTKLDL